LQLNEQKFELQQSLKAKYAFNIIWPTALTFADCPLPFSDCLLPYHCSSIHKYESNHLSKGLVQGNTPHNYDFTAVWIETGGQFVLACAKKINMATYI
jgi:hypothetical protein